MNTRASTPEAERLHIPVNFVGTYARKHLPMDGFRLGRQWTAQRALTPPP
jgi:hypothetical protein